MVFQVAGQPRKWRGQNVHDCVAARKRHLTYFHLQLHMMLRIIKTFTF